MDAEITEEAREAYRANRKWPPETYPGILAIALRDQLAARRRAEWEINETRTGLDPRRWPEYFWTFSQWQEKASKELRGKL